MVDILSSFSFTKSEIKYIVDIIFFNFFYEDKSLNNYIMNFLEILESPIFLKMIMNFEIKSAKKCLCVRQWVPGRPGFNPRSRHTKNFKNGTS